MKDLISNCFLCGEKSLHVAGTEEAQVMQCINCGYTTSTKFTVAVTRARKVAIRLRGSRRGMVDSQRGFGSRTIRLGRLSF